MEVKPGYKQSEVGVIPEEWMATSVGQMIADGLIEKPLDGNHGNIHPKSGDFVDSGIPFVMANNVQDGRVDLVNCSFIRQEQADSLQKGFSRTDDVLLTHKATIGNTAIVGEIPFPYIMLTPQVTYYRVADKEKLSNVYLRYYFDSAGFQSVLRALSGGGTRAYIGISAQHQLPVIVPPNPAEQRAIATALSDVDGLLGGLDRLIAKKRDLKQAAMQQLLTGQTRLPGFHGEWEVKELRQCARFCSGTYLAQEAYRDGPFEVQGAGSPMGKHVVANFAEPVSVIGRVGTVGRPRFMPFGCWVNNNAGAIVALPGEATPRFVHLLLLTMDWSKATSVTAQPFLVIESLMKMGFQLPPVPEQTAIAEVLMEMDLELAALEQRREKTRALKQAMMQELLTGRTRLV